MSSVDQILNYKLKDEEDYYAILGCDEHSSVEQINAEYKARALQFHPDKNAGDKEAEQKFQLLKEAKEVLCDPAKKNNYDKWRNSGISISYKQWLGMKEHVHQSMHWSTPKTKDRMLESGGSSGPSSLGSGNTSAAHRRASEGGANLHWTGRGAGSAWGSEAPSEILGIRNLPKTKERIKESEVVKAPSSLSAGGSPAAHRRASEGGANLFKKIEAASGLCGKIIDGKAKNNEV